MKMKQNIRYNTQHDVSISNDRNTILKNKKEKKRNQETTYTNELPSHILDEKQSILQFKKSKSNKYKQGLTRPITYFVKKINKKAT